MSTNTEQILIEALELIEAGQAPEGVLRRYPDNAAELRICLNTILKLEALPVQPTVVAKQESLNAFLTAAKAEQQQSRPPRLARLLLRPALAMLAIGLIGAGVLAIISGDALPGDSLYVPKRWMEGSRLTFSSDRETQAQLREAFSQERQDEVRALLAMGREAEVTFTGRLETVAADTWTVSGIPVVIDSNTQLDGTATQGRLVAVEGRTLGGGVAARLITVLDGLPEAPIRPAVTPTPDNRALPAINPPVSQPTPTPTQTSTPPPVVTDEPSDPEGNNIGESPRNAGDPDEPDATRVLIDSGNENWGGNHGEDPTDDGGHDSGDDGSHDSGDDGGHDSGDDGSHDSGDDGSHDSGDDGGHDSGDDGNHDSAEEKVGKG